LTGITLGRQPHQPFNTGGGHAARVRTAPAFSTAPEPPAEAQLARQQQCKTLRPHIGIGIEVASSCGSIGQSFGDAVFDDSLAPKRRSIASE
jgi:hypothetical protein